jgi:hydrogenase-4 component F
MGIIAFGTGIGGLGAYGADDLPDPPQPDQIQPFSHFRQHSAGIRQPPDRPDRQPGRSMPKTFVAFFGGFAGISGFPPFGIFIGELLIIIGAFRTGNTVGGLIILSLCVIFAGFANIS